MSSNLIIFAAICVIVVVVVIIAVAMGIVFILYIIKCQMSASNGRKKSTSMCAFRSIQIREQVVCISKYASQGQLENVNLSSFFPSCIAIPHGGIEVDPTFEEISPKIALDPTFRWK